LKLTGFEPTLVERATTLRVGAYVIDFWGLGYDLAERMGLLDEISRQTSTTLQMIMAVRWRTSTAVRDKPID
jgi:2-polyprenyl-6-methoxyphenol hydroxylase-like FAD-dependent oxidoreductase